METEEIRQPMNLLVEMVLDDRPDLDGYTPREAYESGARKMLAYLGLEQVGWMVWEDPQDSDSWIAVGLDDEDLAHYPHRPLFTAIPPSPSGSSEADRG